MKTVFIFPPQWDIFSPSTGIPELMGMLDNIGHETIGFDLNIDFYDYIFTSEYAENALKIAQAIGKKDVSSLDPNSKEFKKINYIKDILSKYGKAFEVSIKNIEKCKNNIKIEKDFFNPILRRRYLTAIQSTLAAISLQYYPYSIGLTSYSNVEEPDKFLEYDCKKLTSDRSTNIFIDYFEQKIDMILEQKPELIGISINSNDQMVAGLTLAKILKERCKCHITIGGTWVESQLHNIKNDKELFLSYIDSCIVGLGETATKELIQYLNGERAIEDVSGLIYMKNGNISENERSNLSLNKIHHASYNGYSFDKYFMAKTVLPIRVSHGCYWGKCSFCNYHINRTYSPRSVDEIIDEIQTLIKAHNVNYFYFQDAALSPAFLDEFSKKIIDKKINIRYLSNVRFEEAFNKKLLKQMYDSGMRVAQWGLESASQDVLNKMHKGIKVESVLRILKNSYEAGLYNHLYLIVNFPGETYENFKETTDFLNKNKKYIQSFYFNNFVLLRDTYIYFNPEKFRIDLSKIDKDNFCFCTSDDLNIANDDKQKLIKNTLMIYKEYYKFEIIGTINQMLLILIDKYPIKYIHFYIWLVKFSQKLNKLRIMLKTRIKNGFKTSINN